MCIRDRALRITPTAQDSYASFTLPAQAGKTYTILGTIYLEGASSGPFQGSTQQRNIMPTFWGGGSYLGTGGSNSTPSPNSAGTYEHRATVTAPTGTTSLIVRLYNGASAGGGVVYWDQILITEGTYSGGYRDGESPNWIWNGTPNNSTSTGPAL